MVLFVFHINKLIKNIPSFTKQRFVDKGARGSRRNLFLTVFIAVES
jgi:hypothetical protein